MLGLLAGCDRLTKSEAESMDAAKGFYAQGDTDSALIEVKGAIQKNASNAESRLLLADIYLKREQGIEAEIELRRAATLGANPQIVAPALGRAMLMQGDFARVLSDVKLDDVTDSSLTASLNEIRGEAQFALRQKKNAEKSFALALAAQPGFPDAIIGQAQLAALARDYPKALDLIQTVLLSDPAMLRALLLKAEIQRYQEKSDEALDTYDKVLQINPTNVAALGDSAYIEIVTGKYDLAEKNIVLLSKSRTFVPTANYLQGLLEFRRKHSAAARISVQRALAADAEHLPSLLLAGVIEYDLGSYDAAERLLRRVVVAVPNTLYARQMLAASLLKLNRGQQAVEVLAPVLNGDIKDPAMLALAGQAYLQNKEYVKATDYFSKAASIDPQDAGTKFRLGVSRLANGETDRALEDLQSVSDLDPQGFQADFIIIISRLRIGDYPGAMVAVESLEKKQPSNPLTYNLKGGVLAAQKDIPQARIAFEKALSLEPKFVPAAMNLARLDLEESHGDMAIKRFEDILAKDNNNVEALVALANLLEVMKRPQSERLALLERARVADPKALVPRMLIVQATLESEPSRAVIVAKESNAIAPQDPSTVDALGMAQFAAGEKGAALSSFNHLVELAPRSVLARMRLATILVQTENLVAATRELRTALELKPDLLEAQALLAQAELQLGHPVETLKIAAQMQKQAPKLAAGYALEGEALVAQGKYAAAAPLFEKALAISPSGSLVMDIYSAYSAAGKPKEAEAVVQRWLASAPDDLDVRGYLANSALKVRRFDKAIEQYRYILQKKPDNVLALNNLAWIYGELKDPQAIPTAEQAYRLKPGDPHVADTFGWLLVENGQTQRGLDVLKKASESTPNAFAVRLHFGQALLKSGDVVKAKQQFESIVSARGAVSQRRDAAAALEKLEQ